MIMLKMFFLDILLRLSGPIIVYRIFCILYTCGLNVQNKYKMKLHIRIAFFLFTPPPNANNKWTT